MLKQTQTLHKNKNETDASQNKEDTTLDRFCAMLLRVSPHFQTCDCVHVALMVLHPPVELPRLVLARHDPLLHPVLHVVPEVSARDARSRAWREIRSVCVYVFFVFFKKGRLTTSLC
jgi:hypothetical protein